MKKFLVFVSLIGVTQTIFAAAPEPPLLLTPLSSPALPSTSPVLFTWSTSKGASVSSYRIIVSTTSDFSGYNQKTKSCRNKIVCFTTTISKPTYSLSNLKSMLQTDNNYFWRVETINNQGTSSSSIAGFAFGSPKTTIDPKYVIVSMPKITAVTTDLSSVEQGKPIKISATLDTAVPPGYKVKIDYGNGLTELTGSAVDYSITITPIKSANYTVGIYDDKNVLRNDKMTGNFEVIAPIPKNIAPVLNLIDSKATDISKVNVNEIYTVVLSAIDDNGDLRQINMEWGDGSIDSVNNVEDGQKLSLTHIYTTAGTSTWKTTAYDYADLASNVISQVVTVSAPIVTTTGTTGTTGTKPPSYTRISIDNLINPPTSMTKWGCTLDTTSNLMWEVKTNDGYLRDKDWTYSWYEPDTKKNPSYRGLENGGVCKGLNKCNTDAYIKKVNAEKLCGKDTWRLPTKKELENLVVCPNGLSPNYLANEISDICAETNPLLDPFNPIPSTPFINNDYFPNTKTDWYWTSETYIPTLSADAMSPSSPLCYPTKATTATTVTPVATTTPTTPTTTATTATTATSVKPVVTTSKPATTPCTTIAPFYDSAWNVGFYDGHTRPDHKGNAVGVRLVSGGAAAATTVKK